MVSPDAGELIVDASLMLESATLGGKNPLELEATSNCADEDGVVVPIPTCAEVLDEKKKQRVSRIVKFFMLIEFGFCYRYCGNIVIVNSGV